MHRFRNLIPAFLPGKHVPREVHGFMIVRIACIFDAMDFFAFCNHHDNMKVTYID